MSSHVYRALDYFMVKNSIGDTVGLMAHGGVAEDTARQIITKFTTDALGLGLSERVAAQSSDDTRTWKKAWADASLAIFMKNGGSKLMQECLAELSAAGYRGGKADEHLLNLATATCGIGQLIMQGVDPLLLFKS